MNLNFELLPWQKEVYGDKTRFKVIVAGRRCGKSRLSAVALLVEGLKCPQGSAVMYVAPTQGQARQIIWDLLMDLGRDVISSSHVNNMDITLINGAKIYVRGADRPDTLRGVSLTFVVLDEVADIKADTWEKVLRAALSDKKGNALFIGTPKGRNWFYDMYNLGLDGDDEEWKSWHFTTRDNPLIDPKEIDGARKTLSSFSFKQEYEASFDNAGTDLFKEKWVKYGEEPSGGVYYIGLDISGFLNENYSSARQKKLDQSAIAVVKVTDDGNWFVKKIEHGRWDTKETAQRILKNIKEFQPVGIGIERGTSSNAVMPYLSDCMRSNNVYAHITDLTHGGKKKTERIVWSLQGRFEHGKITLNEDEDWDEFRDQLLMFPTSQVHDDLVDALSFVDQLAVTTYFNDDDSDGVEPLDWISGY
jgi:phage terminase large subunit-like protein